MPAALRALAPRAIAYISRAITGVEIHPAARIGVIVCAFAPMSIDMYLPALPALEGVVMELDDCAFPLLAGMEAHGDANTAFKEALKRSIASGVYNPAIPIETFDFKV